MSDGARPIAAAADASQGWRCSSAVLVSGIA